MYLVCTGHKEVVWPQHEHEGKSGGEARGMGQQQRRKGGLFILGRKLWSLLQGSMYHKMEQKSI